MRFTPDMKPTLRRVGLTLHVVVSVGWLGAVTAYLALAIGGLTSTDAGLVSGAYLAMETIGWFVVVPLAMASLASGFIQAVGTEWGLFRHYWVVVKFGLTLVSTAILLAHMPAVSRVAAMASVMSLPIATPDVARVQLLVHAAGGLAVLLAITAMSVFKPWGRTRFGQP